MRHRRGDPSGERFDEWETVGDAVAVSDGEWLTLHVRMTSRSRGDVPHSGELKGNGGTTPKTNQKRILAVGVKLLIFKTLEE
jgi:hypothetical protein